MTKTTFRCLSIVAATTLCVLGEVPEAAAQTVTLSQTQATTIEAENYASQDGIRKRPTEDQTPGVYVGWINDTDYTEYDINVLQSGLYTVNARVASDTNGGTVSFRTEDGEAATIDINGTGGWQNWKVVSTTIELEAGEHRLTLDFVNSFGLVGISGFLFNVDWFDLQLNSPVTLVNPVDPVDTIDSAEAAEAADSAVVSSDPVDTTESVGGVDSIDQVDSVVTDDLSEDSKEAAAFLMAASFGPTSESIDELADTGFSEWFRLQQQMPIESILDDTNPTFEDTTSQFWETIPREIWYERAIYGEDQLRQRGAFALSQIFVASTEPRNWLFKAHLHARYMDIMQEGVFGNFRDLIEDVTYSPLMGEWLTYIGNEKADAATGNAPDENYAREFMQLFTIGLLELDDSGEPRLNSAGEVVETYDTEDVTGLAKVFTGLWWDNGQDFGQGAERPANRDRDTKRMIMFDAYHSPEEKSFLGHTIPAGTGGNESIRQALDVIFAHPNIAPFIGKQLIQRLTTSNPSPAYVSRVSDAFNQGIYTLPDGTVIGTGERGDMAPVWAAILFDAEARSESRFADTSYGKIREPLIRWVHWARLAGDVDVNIVGNRDLRLAGTQNTLGQNPFRSNSVFNFFRPGFKAGGSLTAANGLVAPELQITTSTTAINYPNFIREYIFSDNNNNGWMGSYEEQLAAATDADALIDHLNLTMTAGRMTERTKDAVRETFNSVSVSENSETRRDRELRDRVQLVMLLVATSQEFNTQQ